MLVKSINQELIRIGRLLNYWQAELFGTAFLALFLGCAWLGGISDLFLRWGFAGRIVFWMLTMGALAAGLWQVRKALSTRRTQEAVAARVEQVFPQLDNHLINLVQFSAAGTADPIRNAYVRQGVPNWGEVRPAEMREREKHKRAYIGLGAAAVLLLVPFFWRGDAWGNALARILNPFSARAPLTVAHIRGVTPGDGSAVIGTPLIVGVTAAGRPGQPVSVDLWPADDKSYTIRIGQLSGNGPEDFSYAVPKVVADLDYRMRVGDAASQVYHIKAIAPLAYSKIDITVTPPPGLNAPAQHLNGLTDQVVAPLGSRLDIVLRGNRPLNYSMMTSASAQVRLAAGDDGQSYAGTMTIKKDGDLFLISNAEDGETATTTLRVRITPDLPPVIRIIAPQGHGILGAGASPVIQFEAKDDFGLTKVAVEQVDPNVATAEGDTPGKTVQEWPISNQLSFTTTWTGDGLRPKVGQTACFRVVAYDNFAGDQPHRSVSDTIVFLTLDPRDLSAAAVKMAAETQATLDGLVALQTQNLARTRNFSGREPDVTPDQWSGAVSAQKRVWEITGTLLADERKPLGMLQEKVQLLYTQQMLDAINLLQNASTAAPAGKPALVRQAIAGEDFILHILSGVDGAFGDVDRNRRISDILALMDALVHNQTVLNASTKAAADGSSGGVTLASMTKTQDRLSGDADAFAATASAEAANMKGSDAAFAEVLGKVASEFGTRSIPPDMLRASEQLDDKAPAKAQPIQEGVLKNLQDLETMLNSWRADSASARAAAMSDAFQKAASKMNRLAELQAKVVASIRQWKAMGDATTKKESDLHGELEKKEEAMQEAMMQIAADLQIFPEAQLGNDVVKDISTEVAKVKQDAGSEHDPGVERDLQKEDWVLADVEKMAARIKDGLPTLATNPNGSNFKAEDFDKQEFPGPVAAIPLADKFQDLIGDLLKQDKDIENNIKSSATNQAVKDLYMEGAVAEGEWASYSAKGVSGNQRPKNTEQSGRSNIGRQGMSDGESAAASGKINEGDNNIKKRMTQDAAQSGDMGKIDDSGAKTVATGGGKLSGSADQFGMAGNGPRRDSKSGGGNGMLALLQKRADALYAAASLEHVRSESLQDAVVHLRDAQDAEEEGKPMEEVREYLRMAREALQKSQVDLQGGITTEAAGAQQAPPANPGEVAGAADEAPVAYRDLVSDYYKSINDAPQH